VKILARRVLTCQEVLGINSPAFFPTVLEAIVDAHREWPKLGYACSKALRYLADHSKLFQKTMTRGHRQLEQYLSDNDGVTLTGQQIVSLEKDYGMPSLLVMVALRDRALPMEHAGYKLALEKWHSTRNTLHQSA
jgi:alanyl-tRNA synthetase